MPPNPVAISDVLSRLSARQVGRGYRASCPAHGGDNPSALVINEGEDGKVLLYCHAHGCTYEDILRALGLWDASATPSTNRKTGQTKTPKATKLTEDKKIILVTAGREAMGLLCGPLPDHPTDPELIPPYGGFSKTSGRRTVRAAATRASRRRISPCVLPSPRRCRNSCVPWIDG